eukprot:31524-Pelagococcus_subviridis.AAC.10
MDAGLTILRVGGIDCATVKDEYFNSIRRFCNVSDCFLAGNFDFENLSSGGGKGGDLLSRTLDGKYIVKQLNGCDSKSLLEKEFLKSYVDLVSSGSSFICKIVAVFLHPKLGNFLAMINCLPTHVESWSGIFDVKGTADDKVLVEDGTRVPEVHKRCWNLKWMLSEAIGCEKCVPTQRRRYIAGKKTAYRIPLYVTKDQKVEILNSLDEALTLFEQYGLMDYSMIIGIFRPPPSTTASELLRLSSLPNCKAYLSQHCGDTTVIYFGLIDFLQAWTGAKKCASVMKTCCAPAPISTISPKKYARQFRKLRGVAHDVISSARSHDSLISSKTATCTFFDEVDELKATVGWLHEKLARVESRITELEK